MATIVDVMSAVETLLDAIPGMNINEEIADDMPTPAAFVVLPSIPKYHGTMAHGKMDYDLQILVLTTKLISRVGLHQLALAASPSGAASVHAKLMTDPKLNNTVEDSFIASFDPLPEDQAARLGFIGGVFTLHIISAGS